MKNETTKYSIAKTRNGKAVLSERGKCLRLRKLMRSTGADWSFAFDRIYLEGAIQALSWVLDHKRKQIMHTAPSTVKKTEWVEYCKKAKA